jgi:hypothetical protein
LVVDVSDGGDTEVIWTIGSKNLPYIQKEITGVLAGNENIFDEKSTYYRKIQVAISK